MASLSMAAVVFLSVVAVVHGTWSEECSNRDRDGSGRLDIRVAYVLDWNAIGNERFGLKRLRDVGVIAKGVTGWSRSNTATTSRNRTFIFFLLL